MTSPDQKPLPPTLDYQPPDPPRVSSGARIIAGIAALVFGAFTFGLWQEYHLVDRSRGPAMLVAFSGTVFCLFVALGLI
jgi:hypothetical protein